MKKNFNDFIEKLCNELNTYIDKTDSSKEVESKEVTRKVFLDSLKVGISFQKNSNTFNYLETSSCVEVKNLRDSNNFLKSSKELTLLRKYNLANMKKKLFSLCFEDGADAKAEEKINKKEEEELERRLLEVNDILVLGKAQNTKLSFGYNKNHWSMQEAVIENYYIGVTTFTMHAWGTTSRAHAAIEACEQLFTMSYQSFAHEYRDKIKVLEELHVVIKRMCDELTQYINSRKNSVVGFLRNSELTVKRVRNALDAREKFLNLLDNLTVSSLNSLSNENKLFNDGYNEYLGGHILRKMDEILDDGFKRNQDLSESYRTRFSSEAETVFDRCQEIQENYIWSKHHRDEALGQIIIQKF